MSNVYCEIAYGIPLYEPLDVPCEEFLDSIEESGIQVNRLYDQAGDFYWIGNLLGGFRQGFSALNDIQVPFSLITEMEAVWKELPEKIQKNMSKPHLFVMMGID